MRHEVPAATTRRARFIAPGAIVALLCAAAGPSVGADSGVTRHVIEQPPQALADALRSIARQTGASVLFDPGVVNGRVARPVSGRLSAAEAIARAIDGSGLTADVMRDGAIVVRPAPRVPQTAGGARSTSFTDVPPISGPAPARLQLAQAVAPAASAAGAAMEGAGGAVQNGQRIEVTGSRLKRITAEGPVPVNAYTREDINRSGQPTLERFLSSLNEVSVTTGEGAVGTTLGQGTVQLRGLPLGSTLVLINGRRVQAVGSSTANYFNLNLIPLAAVERVEVVPVGSSAIYGGDALAGVVNVILKNRLDGLSLSARVGGASGTSDRSLSLATGGSGDDGSYLLLASASRTTPLNMTERPFFVDADYRRFGGPDARLRNCAPGTVTSTGSAPLPGLGSNLAGIPRRASDEPLTVSSFAATAGQANLCNVRATGLGQALVHGTESLGLHAAGDRRIAGDWSLFGEFTYADDRLRAEEMGVSLNNVLVPAANPYNPFGVPVRVTTVLGPDNGLQVFARHTRFARALAGMRGELGGGWDAEWTGSTTQDRSLRLATRSTLNAAARDAALSTTSLADALDPFATGRAASNEVLGRIWADSEREGRGRRDQLSGFVRGPVMTLPAGPAEAIVGLEAARDEFTTAVTGDGALSKTDSRRSSAGYAELRVPLLRSDPTVGGTRALAALTMAARHDRYSDFGSANTYQAGLEMRPSRDVLLRASVATSFKPPTLNQMNVDSRSFAATDFSLVDPARSGERILSGEVVRSTNQDLKPEKGKAFALGAVWEPDGLAGTRLGLTAWRVRIEGLIGILDPQVALNNETRFPGFVTRGPSAGGMPGPVTMVRYAEVNYGSVDTAGTDFEASHTWRTGVGRLSLGAGVTHATEYRVALTPSTPAESRLGRRYRDYWAPRWKGRVSIGLDRRPWSLNLTSRHLGSYNDAGTSTRRLGGLWVHDLAGSLDLKRLGVGLGGAKAATLSLAIANLADRLPQFVETSPYYDVTQADWRGRYASLRLSVDW